MLKLFVCAAAISALSCTAQSAGGDATTPGQPQTEKDLIEEQARKIAGTYTCSLEVAGTTTDGSCTIRKSPTGYSLQTTGARPPLSGTVEPTESGFRVQGEVACEGEGCPQDVDTEFFDQGDGSYSGVFATDQGIVNVTMRK